MFCTQCGSQAKVGDRFCAGCGTPISGTSGESSSPLNPAPIRQDASSKIEHVQSKTTAALQAAAPSASVLGRKGLKWGLRLIGLFLTMIVILVWREASMKSGMDGGVMGAFRGVIVFGTYLAFFEWTKSLDPDTPKGATDNPAPRIIGAELAKFVAVSTLAVAIAYKIAPHNINPEAVWWVAIIGMAVFTVWLWREKKQVHQPSNLNITDPASGQTVAESNAGEQKKPDRLRQINEFIGLTRPTTPVKRSAFEKAVVWTLVVLLVLIIVVPILGLLVSSLFE